MTSRWLDDKKPPNVETLTNDELLDLWEANRNGIQGQVAADERMKRLSRQRKETKK